MNLWLVTYNRGGEQFLVDAPNIETAITKAINANKTDILGECDAEDLVDINNVYLYDAEAVEMDLLGEMCMRDDYLGNANGTLIFSGF